MAWLDDRIWSLPKFVLLSDRAFRVWVNSVAYSSGYVLHGRLEVEHQKLVGASEKTRKELLEKRCWDDARDGTGAVLVHDWEDHNGKRDKQREKDRIRKREQRMSARASKGQSVGQSNGASEVSADVEGSEGSEGSEQYKIKSKGAQEIAVRQTEVEPITSQHLVAYFVDTSKSLGGDDPPRRVTGHIARLCGELLSEGVDPKNVRAGIDLLLEKRLHPSTLPSLVHEASLPRGKAGRQGRVTPSDILARAQELHDQEEAMFHETG